MLTCKKSDRVSIGTVGTVVILLSTIGCGTKIPSRQSIGGTVSVSPKDPDEKLQTVNGSITLLPTGGQSGPAASATIDNGRYEFSSANGPLPGTYRVVVKLSQNPDAAISDETVAPRGKADLMMSGNKKPGTGNPATRAIEFQTSVEIEVGKDAPYDFKFTSRGEAKNSIVEL